MKNGYVADALKDPMLSFERIWALRKGSHVKRWHTERIIGEQTVGKHSLDALSMLLVLHPNPTITLIRAMAWHDMAESRCGDLPSHVLWRHNALRIYYEDLQEDTLQEDFGLHLSQLTEEEKIWINAIDKLEAYLFSIEQVSMGNTGAFEFVERLEKWFREQPRLPAAVAQMIELQQHLNNGKS